MKRKIFVLFLAVCIIALCHTACTKEANGNNTELLEFPGVNWGTTVEEVKAALKVKNEQIIQDEFTSSSEHQLVLTNVEYFGGKVELAYFKFTSLTGGIPVLYDIRLNYSADTDMAVIRDNLIKLYGPGTNYGFTDYAIHEGKAKSFVNYNRSDEVEYGTNIESNAFVEIPVKDVYHRWASTVNGSEIISTQVAEGMITALDDTADRENVLEYINNHVWVTITCADDTGWYQNTVRFAAEYIPIVQRFGK